MSRFAIWAVFVGHPAAAISAIARGDWRLLVWISIATAWFLACWIETKRTPGAVLLLPPGERVDGIDESELANRIVDALRGKP